MKKDYRIVTNNDTLEIVMENKLIKLILVDREGGDVNSKILKKVYTPKVVEGYDAPQFLEHDFHEIIDSFKLNDVEIWGVKDEINIGLPNGESEYKEICNWYIDKAV